ncbi:MAG: radical SAM protein [Pseudomonadota bacterium]
MSLPQAPPSPRPRYLVVRVLEACNAGCFMCGFSRSRSEYRYPAEHLARLLPDARAHGVRFLRFTGGEPLLHGGLERLLRLGAAAGMRCSLITNGAVLAAHLPMLVDCGLEHLVVSLDAADGATHDRLRRTPGLFERAVEGLRGAIARGLTVRVNTVVGPHNAQQMVSLRDRLLDLGVAQWELSTLKLEGALRYPDPDAILAIGAQIYTDGGGLRPLGLPWYGADPAQRLDYFERGLPPRPTGPRCHVTSDVTYLDARRGLLHPCSCLPHRRAPCAPDQPALSDARLPLDSAGIQASRAWFFAHGARSCTGCSATAAGYSDAVAAGEALPAWSY